MSLYDEAVLVMKPNAYEVGKLYSVLPDVETTDVGYPLSDADFDVARAGIKTKTNSSLQLEEIAANVPALNYDTVGGCPHQNTEGAATNLLPDSNKFGKASWTKSGATIEGDPSTAGVDLLDGWDFTSSWTSLGDGSVVDNNTFKTTTSNGGIYHSSLVLSSGQMYKMRVVGDVSDSYFRVRSISGVTYATLTGTFDETFYFESESTTLYLFLGTTIGATANVSIMTLQKVSGYQSPSVDHPDAWKLVEDGATGAKVVSSGNIAFTSGEDYTASYYVKYDSRQFFTIRHLSAAFGIDYYGYFDIQNGTLGTIPAGATAKIKDVGNGWYRCSLTATATVTTSTITRFYITDTDGSLSYTGDGTSGIYLYGAQLEEGSVATSPIYTDGATATRLADAVTGAGSSALFSGVNSSGVLYAEIAALSDDLTARVISISDGTSINRVRIRTHTVSNQIRCTVTVSSATQADVIVSVSDITDYNKIAVRWNVNDFSFYINGVEVGTDLSGSIFPANTLSEVAFDDGSGTSNFYGNTKSVAVYNYLTDEQMIELTTP